MTKARDGAASLDSQVAQVLGSDEASIFGPAFFLRHLDGFVQGLLFVAASARVGALLAAWIYNRASGSAALESIVERP